MISNVKLRARALQQQKRAHFAAVFAFRLLTAALPVSGGAAALFLLSGALRVLAVAGCAAVLVFALSAGSFGSALCFSAAAQDEKVRFRLILSAFWGKKLLRAAASFLLSGAVQLLFAALFCAPTAGAFWLLAHLLRQGLPVFAALSLTVGAAGTAVVAAVCLLRLRALFAARAFLLANGAGVLQSVTLCLRFREREAVSLFSLQRSFFGWTLLCLFLLPMPFVWAYLAQSRAVLLQGMMKSGEFGAQMT